MKLRLFASALAVGAMLIIGVATTRAQPSQNVVAPPPASDQAHSAPQPDTAAPKAHYVTPAPHGDMVAEPDDQKTAQSIGLHRKKKVQAPPKKPAGNPTAGTKSDDNATGWN